MGQFQYVSGDVILDNHFSSNLQLCSN